MLAVIEAKEVKTCQHCGFTGESVEYRTSYVGGKGLVSRPECTDSVSFWQRWDKANGLTANVKVELEK